MAGARDVMKPIIAELRKVAAALEAAEADRHWAEQQLTERANYLRTIIESEPECVKLLAVDGTLLEMNPAGLAMVDAESSDQVVGKCIYPLVASPYRAAFIALTERVFRGEAGVLEFEAIGLRGTHRWLETHAAPLWDAQGQVIAALGITRDITERKHAEHALGQAKQMEGIVLAAREVGHLLNNDLAVPTGALEILQRDPTLPVHLRGLVDEAAAALTTAAEHIHQFQQVVRIETKDTPQGPALDLARSTQGARR
jgi:PAS domain S-box-containing protein